MYATKPEGGTFKPVPEGVHQAVCFRIIDLGTQVSEYQGKEKIQRKILVSWEFPHELKDGFTTKAGEEIPPRPYAIHQKYTFSFFERSRLRQDLESWRGRAFTEADFNGPPDGFHLAKLLGVNCQINVIHNESNGNTYANIKALMPLAKGMPKVEATDPPIYFDMTSAETFEQEVFDGLWDTIKETISISPEFRQLVTTKAALPYTSEGESDYTNRGSTVHAKNLEGPKQDFDLDDEIPF